MSLLIRKTFKVGPLRLTASRSGLSVSAGIKGARITYGPRGTYVTVGAGGISYRQCINSQPKSREKGTSFISFESDIDPLDFSVIKTAPASDLVESSNHQMLQSINSRLIQRRSSIFFIPLVIIFFFLFVSSNLVISWLVLVFGLAIGYFLHQGDEHNRSTPIYYDLTSEAKQKFDQIKKSVLLLSSSQRIWRIETRQHTHDWKRNAGAGNLITRKPIGVMTSKPPYINSNVDSPVIKLGSLELYFFPDVILVREKGIYGAVNYNSFSILFKETSFIEEEAAPSDAEVIRHTWKFVRRDGGPDRRFSNNRQIPVMRYAEINLKSSTGLNVVMHVSNVDLARKFSASQLYN
jgi:Protein of unknown function (DUF4236)